MIKGVQVGDRGYAGGKGHHSSMDFILDTDASQPELTTNFREDHLSLTLHASELTRIDA